MRPLSARWPATAVLFGLVGLAGAACETAPTAGSASTDAGAIEGDDAGAPSCPTLPTPVAFAPPAATHRLAMDDTLRLNHVQTKGTHNSYHLRPTNPLVDWAYSHVPLAEQFDVQGVRAVELDLQWNAACRGFEVYHIGTFDDRSTCRVFTDCLLALRGWSSTHPGHHAIFVQIEPKWSSDATVDEARMLVLEKEILSVFPRPWLITPDDVRGSSASLAKGIAERGWPTLGETRGRVLFFLNDGGGIRDAYSRKRTSLDGRLLFAEASPGEATAGVMILNDPVGGADAIKKALAAGYIVRTRADALPSTL